MKSKTVYRLIASLILTVGHLTSVIAVTDAELEALEKQLGQLESEENKIEAEVKRKAEKNERPKSRRKKND